MGNQCANVAKLVRLSGHEAPKHKDILDSIERMGQLARSQASQAKQAFATRTIVLAQDLVGLDGKINRLNREIITRAVDIGDDLEVREWAMFMILVARCLERIAGNTIDIAEQTGFVVTGLFREFAGDSHSQPAYLRRACHYQHEGLALPSPYGSGGAAGNVIETRLSSGGELGRCVRLPAAAMQRRRSISLVRRERMRGERPVKSCAVTEQPDGRLIDADHIRAAAATNGPVGRGRQNLTPGGVRHSEMIGPPAARRNRSEYRCASRKTTDGCSRCTGSSSPPRWAWRALRRWPECPLVLAAGASRAAQSITDPIFRRARGPLLRVRGACFASRWPANRAQCGMSRRAR